MYLRARPLSHKQLEEITQAFNEKGYLQFATHVKSLIWYPITNFSSNSDEVWGTHWGYYTLLAWKTCSGWNVNVTSWCESGKN
ncbi:MAG: hypothetical protein IJ215_02800 [Clostridia bacterium]|nr:hypothetical protein [Clostridia bacterium]